MAGLAVRRDAEEAVEKAEARCRREQRNGAEDEQDDLQHAGSHQPSGSQQDDADDTALRCASDCRDHRRDIDHTTRDDVGFDKDDGEVGTRRERVEHRDLRHRLKLGERCRGHHDSALDLRLQACLQDLEAPLRRQFSSRALGIAEQQTLETVTAVGGGTSTARRLIDDADQYGSHESSFESSHASHAR